MQLEQTVKGGVGHNQYWPLGQGRVKARIPNRHRGKVTLLPCETTVHAEPRLSPLPLLPRH